MDAPQLRSLTPLIPGGARLDDSLAFYEQKLGFSRTWQDGDPVQIAGVRRDSVEIILYRHDDRYLADQTSFRVRVEDVARLYADLQANGVAIHPNGALQTKPWGTREFALIDPAGVCITFYERNG
jgi:uncharacterized glyoxalase superfamily protein PhnB